jgi:hypothetical protein
MAAGPAAAGGALWPRANEFLRLKEQTQKVVALDEVEVGKEYYLQFGYVTDPLLRWHYSIATCTRDIGGVNKEKEFTGDIIDRDGVITTPSYVFRVNKNSSYTNIFIWPPPNAESGASRELHPHAEWNGGSGGTASRKKSRKLKRKNRKSRKSRKNRS